MSGKSFHSLCVFVNTTGLFEVSVLGVLICI